MASDAENLIIIPSDDESDNDDVVLIKEEIEVDSDDVIFLSETKAPPKSEVLDSRDDTTTIQTSAAGTLNRSTSITTRADQLSLDDADDDDSSLTLNTLPQFSGLSNSIGPLDLSAKSCDDTLQARGASAKPQNSVFGDTGSSSAFQDLANQLINDKFTSLIFNPNSSVDDNVQTNVCVTNSSECGSVNSKLTISNAKQGTCDKTRQASVCSEPDHICKSDQVLNKATSPTSSLNMQLLTWLPTSAPDLPQPHVSGLSGQLNQLSNPDSGKPSGAGAAMLNLPVSACDQASSVIVDPASKMVTDSGNLVSSAAADSTTSADLDKTKNVSMFNRLLKSTQDMPVSDPYATSHFLLSSLDPFWCPATSAGPYPTLVPSSTVSGCNTMQGSTEVTSVNSVVVSQTGLSNSMPGSTSSIPFNSSADLQSDFSAKPSNSLTAQLLSSMTMSKSVTSDVVLTTLSQTDNTFASTLAGASKAITDVTQSSPIMSSQTGTCFPFKTDPISVSSNGSVFHTQSNDQKEKHLNKVKGGLLGGSLASVPLSSTTVSSSGSNFNNPSSSQQPYNSVFSSDMCYYNSLTLPVSMQNQSLMHLTASPSGASGSQSKPWSFKASSDKNMLKQSRRGSSSRSLSPQPHGSFPLPPKKQKRCYSDAGGDNTCTSCCVTLMGEKFSRCPNMHSVCSKCLEERVKLVLTGKAKESVKCLNKSCDSFYPISELKHSLPAMVVEILEDKLDQEYVDYISDMIMKNASTDQDPLSSEQEEATLPPLRHVHVQKETRKYEDCPDNWDEMEEKVVSKNGYMLIPLEESSGEFEKVVMRFFESMVDSNVEVTRISRVQNPIQWKYYTVKKTEMLQDNEGFGGVEEQQLFHGTTATVVDNICRKGFDWRLCGKHGTLYGQGSYFAKKAAYSHQYTDLKQGRGPSMRSSMMLPNPMSMTLPTTPSLYPALNIAFSQMRQSVLPSGSGISQCSTFRPINLSHNSNPPSAHQSAGTNLNQTNALSQNVSGQPIFLRRAMSHGSSSSLLGYQMNTNMAHSNQVTSSKPQASHNTLVKVVRKPVAIRRMSGLPSTDIISSTETMESTRPTAKVFLARVLVGKFVGGSPKLRKPPPLSPKTDPYGKCYDSCVDDINGPKIFVIFDSAQAYPEYLIEYSYSDLI